jgi:hypothetical protein
MCVRKKRQARERERETQKAGEGGVKNTAMDMPSTSAIAMVSHSPRLNPKRSLGSTVKARCP